MKYYIDFDGVILDTEKLIFENWHKEEDRSEEAKIRYLQRISWSKIIENSMVINNSLNILRTFSKEDTCILTKVHSATNEGASKILFLRREGIELPVVLVPYPLKKTDLVDAKNNILVDDALFNLDAWVSCGGIPLYFNKDNSDIDSWGIENTKYQKIKTLSNIKKYKR